MTQKSNNEVEPLFGESVVDADYYRGEWTGMPEFVQEKQEPFAKIIVRFSSQADLDDFAKIIGQSLTSKTKSIWHPFRSHWGATRSVYVDASSDVSA